MACSQQLTSDSDLEHHLPKLIGQHYQYARRTALTSVVIKRHLTHRGSQTDSGERRVLFSGVLATRRGVTYVVLLRDGAELEGYRVP